MDQLARSAPAKQVKVLPEDITKAQSALVQCYRDNKDRSLDCWKEVQEFKDLVQKAQNVSWHFCVAIVCYTVFPRQ